ncbi:hypothetical protein GCM10010452_62570 [Crossiella cryophila]
MVGVRGDAEAPRVGEVHGPEARTAARFPRVGIPARLEVRDAEQHTRRHAELGGGGRERVLPVRRSGGRGHRGDKRAENRERGSQREMTPDNGHVDIFLTTPIVWQ